MVGPMAGFASDDRGLVCDDVPVAEIAARVGTPVHVYSAALIRERYRALDAAFASRPHRLHYAIKANSTTAVVRELRSLGARADANSGGEIEVALRAGFSAEQIVFTGVGKTRAELERAIGLGVGDQRRIAGRGGPHRGHCAGARHGRQRCRARESRCRRRRASSYFDRQGHHEIRSVRA